ncbi:MAG: oligosaccharide flippase family protein [Candidatus Sulfotelmatobacter sp.]
MSGIPIVEPEAAVSTGEGSVWEYPATLAARFIPGLKGKQYSKTLRTALHGSTWTMLGYGGTQVVRTASTIILARLLLGPKDFGLVALVNVFLGGLDMLSDLGIGMDVVQNRRGDDPVFINTAFLIQVGRGLIIWAVATALAYPFAVFYKQPALLWLAMVGAISTGLRGFTSGSVWTMTRHVQLRKLTILTLISEGAGFIVALVWAIASPSAWALVVSRVASALVYMVGTHVVAENKVSTRWDPQAAREILYFGAGIFVSTATYFLGGEAERLVVGKFVDLVELGCFSLALTISSVATTGLRQIISQVFFPMMAQKVRDDPEKAAKHYKGVRLGLLALSACLAVGFIVGSRWIVALLLGPKYVMTGWILQLLGFRGALELFTAATSAMLFTVGTAKYAATGNVTKILFLAAGLAVAFTRFGFAGAVWVLAVSPIAAYIPLLVGMQRHFKSTMRTELFSFALLLVCGALTAAFLRMIA